MNLMGPINCALPFCRSQDKQETKLSICLRILFAGLSAIALLVGVLILCKISGLHALGSLSGGLFIGIGLCVLFASLSIRCVKKHPYWHFFEAYQNFMTQVESIKNESGSEEKAKKLLEAASLLRSVLLSKLEISEVSLELNHKIFRNPCWKEIDKVIPTIEFYLEKPTKIRWKILQESCSNLNIEKFNKEEFT